MKKKNTKKQKQITYALLLGMGCLSYLVSIYLELSVWITRSIFVLEFMIGVIACIFVARSSFKDEDFWFYLFEVTSVLTLVIELFFIPELVGVYAIIPIFPLMLPLFGLIIRFLLKRCKK